MGNTRPAAQFQLEIIFVLDERTANVRIGIQITGTLGIYIVKKESVLYAGYTSSRTEDVLCRKLYCVEGTCDG